MTGVDMIQVAECNGTRMTHMTLKAAAALACLVPTTPAPAESYPERLVTLIVPYPAGGGTDTAARALARSLSRHWNQSVVVENVAGADGLIGTQKMLRANPDGYTLLVPASQAVLWKTTNPKVMIDLQKDFRLVTKIGDSAQALSVNSKFPAESIGDLAALCRKQNCALGSGTMYSEIMGRHLMSLAGVELSAVVPYKGTLPMLTDVMGGHIQMGIAPVAAALAYKESGLLKSLAVLSKDRDQAMPSVQTSVEQGYPVSANGWYALVAARDIPQHAFDAISNAVQSLAQDGALRDAIIASGSRPVFSTPEAFASDLQREIDDLGPVLATYAPRN